MPTFQTFLLREPYKGTPSLLRASDFKAAADERIENLNKYKSDWREATGNQFRLPPEPPSALEKRMPRLLAQSRFDASSTSARHANRMYGRMRGHHNDVKIMRDALARYHAAAGPRSKSADKEILGCLIVDIYTASAQFMRRVSRGYARTDEACILFQLYRNLNIAAEKAFAKVFEDQQIELYIQQQNIALTHHGSHLDEILFKDTQRNIKYFKDARALGFRLEISGGKIYQRDMRRPGKFKLMDTTSPEYRDANINPCYSDEPHVRDDSSKDGVTGYAMLSNRQIYATMHSADPTAGSVFHSAYSAGNEILCSGTLGIKQGVLTYIDNSSGHYKPTAEQLSLCIQSLRTSGVDISNLTVFSFAKIWAENVSFVNAVQFIERYTKGTFAVNAQGRYRATAVRIRDAVHKYEKRQTGVFSSYRHPSLQTRAAIQRLKFIIQTRNDEALVRTVEVLIGRTHKFQDGMSDPQEMAVPAPDVTDDRADSKGAAVGTAFAPLATLPDRPDKGIFKNRGPGGLKKLLIEAMKDYNPV